MELADLIWKLRSELTRAMFGGEGKDLRFRAESVQLELTVAVERVSDPAVKVKFWVLDGSAGRKHGNTATQKVTLTLHPEVSGVPGAAALIGGEADDDER